jgi:hypothetical protein
MLCSRAEILVALKKASSNLSADDLALIDMLHALAEQAVKDEIGNDVEYGLKTEILPLDGLTPSAVDLTSYEMVGGRVVPVEHGGGQQRLQLQHTPVWLTNLQVWEDTDAYGGQAASAFGSDTLLTRGEDYLLHMTNTEFSRTGLLIRISGAWDPTPGSIKVSYYGGWTAAQLAPRGCASAIRWAVIDTATAAYWSELAKIKTLAGNISSETIGKYSVSYGGAGGGAGLSVQVPPAARVRLGPFKHMGF